MKQQQQQQHYDNSGSSGRAMTNHLSAHSATNSSSMILAANYVPQHAIQWKELPPSITLSCRPLENSNSINNSNNHITYDNNDRKNSNTTQQQRHEWGDDQTNHNHINHYSHHNHHSDHYHQQPNDASTTFRSISTNTNAGSATIPLSWPNAILEFNNEFRYAIEAKKQRNYWLMSQRQQGHHHPHHDILKIRLPHIRDIPENDISLYVRTYQALIQAERHELLMKYDDYTQYEQMIHVGDPFTFSQQSHHRNQQRNNNKTSTSSSSSGYQPHATTTTAMKQPQSSSSPTTEQMFFLTVCIPGIADSKPLPQRGDWLLLRPISYISMPIMNHEANSNSNRSSPIDHQHHNYPNNSIPHTNHASSNGTRSSDIATAIVGWTPACHVVDISATIMNVSRANHDGMVDMITATWLPPEQDAILRTTYGIEQRPYQLRIIPNKKEYERCMIALLWLNTLSSSNIMHPILFPTHAPQLYIPSYPPVTSKLSSLSISSTSSGSTSGSTQLINYDTISELNTQQITFIRILLARTNQPSYDEIRSPVILTGPAGTGKTKTLLYAILEILQQTQPNGITATATTSSSNMHRILICTPSHTAANVITQRLAKYLKPNEMFRLLDSDRHVVTIPINILSYCYQSITTNNFDIPSFTQLMQYRVIVSTCTDAFLLYRIGFTNQQIHQKRIECSQHIKEICLPYNMNVTFSDSIHTPHFTHFFMDEAAQATEPESLIPLSVVVDPTAIDYDYDNNNNVSNHSHHNHSHDKDKINRNHFRKVEIGLVGDPRQLSPSIYSNEASNAGLSCSWIERLLRRPVSCLRGNTITAADAATKATLSATTSSVNDKEDHINDDHSSSLVAAPHEKRSQTDEQDTDDDDMLGPELMQMDQWIRYSMEQDGNEYLSMFLILNYRGHPSFLMIPSSLFYMDRLQKAHVLATEDESIQTEHYWCQKLRLLEALVQPVVSTSSPQSLALKQRELQQKQNEQGNPEQHQQEQKKLDNINNSNNKNSNGSNSNARSRNKNNNRKKRNGNKKHESVDGNTNENKKTENITDATDENVIAPEFVQHKQWNWPIHFRGVIGNDKNSSIQSHFSTDSWCNEEEANVVYEIINEITSNGKVSTNSIGVIAPFRGQVVLIRKVLRSKGLGSIDVGTIEDYQSAERDVIILSLTRSSKTFTAHDNEHRIGIFGSKQAKRCNVALTRARNLFIVVGNPRIMMEDFLWRQFLWFCYRNVLWYGDFDGVISSFSWNKDLKVLNSYDILKENQDPQDDAVMETTRNTNNTNNNMEKSIHDQNNKNIIVISTLERKLRHVK